jgi:tRNA-specific 2-thiouridylase
MVIKKKKIIVAMSGGVDSSVAAKLLKDEGFESVGIFLHFWKDQKTGKNENKCCSQEALMDARRVCRKIGMPLYTLNFSNVFKKEVVDYFLNEYKRGNTPNPCVRCNKSVKLGLLIERAKKLGFNYVASGHYVKIKRPKAGGSYKLYRARDKEKDQSYFLWTLTQKDLSRLFFPLGDYEKTKVRKLAKKFNLPTAAKKESQEICFISGKNHNDFLKRYIKLKPGLIKTLDGKTIGEHQGLPLYTIGQRKGVEIGGIGPFYVAKSNYKTNTLYVVKNGEDLILYKKKLAIEETNWIAGTEPKFPFACEAVIRYRHKPAECKIEKLNSKRKKGEYSVNFKKPQRAITPGQSVVFYRKDEVIGGGIIKF